MRVVLLGSWLDQQMQQLEGHWRRQGAPIADHLAPGATTDHLQAVQSCIGLTIPPELVQWWSWHDGVRREQPSRLEADVGPGDWEFLSSTEAAEDREWLDDLFGGEVADPHAVDPPGFATWHSSWLPVFRSGPNRLLVNTRTVVPTTGTVPVRYRDHTPEDTFTPVAGAFTHLIATWVHLFDTGVYTWSAEQEHWLADPEFGPRYLQIMHVT